LPRDLCYCQEENIITIVLLNTVHSQNNAIFWLHAWVNTMALYTIYSYTYMEATFAWSCAPLCSTVVLCMHTVCTVAGRVSRAWPQWHLRYDNWEKEMIHKCRETCSCKESITSWLQHCICHTWWGFSSIYGARLYKNIKKLEENSMVENNLKAIHKDKTPTITKALILFCERARSIKPPVPITVESVSAKEKVLLLNC